MARKKLTKKQLMMARKYESAWHYLFNQESKFVQEGIIAEPLGPRASTFAQRVATFAESKDCPVLPPVPKFISPTGMNIK
jgi:hypothetical protein